MSEQNEQVKAEFESWYDDELDEPLPTDYTIMGKRYLYMGYRAAWQHQQQRIDELREDLLDLRQQVNYRCADVQSLQAQLNVAVDALISNNYDRQTEALNTINKMKGE